MAWRLLLSATRTNITDDAIVAAIGTGVNLVIETEVPCTCVMHDVYQGVQRIEVLPRVTLTFNVCYMRLFQLFRVCVGLSLLSYIAAQGTTEGIFFLPLYLRSSVCSHIDRRYFSLYTFRRPYNHMYPSTWHGIGCYPLLDRSVS